MSIKEDISNEALKRIYNRCKEEDLSGAEFIEICLNIGLNIAAYASVKSSHDTFDVLQQILDEFCTKAKEVTAKGEALSLCDEMTNGEFSKRQGSGHE